jgi:lipopolysaccharide export system permease protein
MNIRVGHQDPETQLLTDVLIYDTRERNGNMTTTVADSGYIYMSDDKKFLMIKLFNGETFETTRNYKWSTENAVRHQVFAVQNGALAIDGFDFSRTDMSLFSNHQTKNISELQVDIDSLRHESDRGSARSYEPLLKSYLLVNDQSAFGLFDTVKVDYSYKKSADIMAAIDSLPIERKAAIISRATTQARLSRNSLNRNEDTAKDSLNKLYRSHVEWHRKVALPISVIIFFLIGAPLGAIIRKGGLAMPVVVSVLFFVVYYIISIAGEKMAKEGTWDAGFGMWFSSLVLLPIAIYLTRIATNDSNLFNVDWYAVQINKLKARIVKLKKASKE